MCFGSKSQPATPKVQQPTMVDNTPPAPDYSQAALYRGRSVGENTTGRVGGPYLLAAADKAKSNLGE